MHSTKNSESQRNGSANVRRPLADPAYRQHQQEKRRGSTTIRRKRLARIHSPEYQEAQREKQRIKRQESAQKPRTTLTVTKPRKTSMRGLKGRTPTADERRVMDALAKLPCTACWLHKHHQLIVSLHHVNGRTAAGAHMDVLPLCRWHHRDAAPKADREQYPWLVPVHASGNVGGKAEFTRLNASEEDLLLMAYKQAGITREGR